MQETITLEKWPALPFTSWQDTCETLHLWTQIVGKVRLGLCPPTNHWWQSTLYLSARGLTTSPIPYPGGIFEISFDFIGHKLLIETSQGERKILPLAPRSVATFYREVMDALKELHIPVRINPLPNEIKDPIPFDQDEIHAAYDPVMVERFWRILLQTDTIFKEFRGRFIGKSSPVHFFWGSFDLAVTRFSGQKAPERPGADLITREAYSHEVISCGFWPGNADFPQPAFYTYAAPEPAGLGSAAIKPAKAFHNADLAEFFYLYDDMRQEAEPEQALLDFLQSTYAAAADLAHWDRAALEREA
ncbi:hypothetical protein KDA_23960 [Dictyobacter alpinus]|uniref:Ava_C0101 and related proteins n=1 Tax=Dictyobacter alpinus TaxID=2014873 RepID=A0A402B6E1_9CHLR|nr:DUF5996 family protein [Dictyobacter alpinus]GCE26912.1 hypothetical protein KDA_23960 [Dictyobacter alpinus]